MSVEEVSTFDLILQVKMEAKTKPHDAALLLNHYCLREITDFYSFGLQNPIYGLEVFAPKKCLRARRLLESGKTDSWLISYKLISLVYLCLQERS